MMKEDKILSLILEYVNSIVYGTKQYNVWRTLKVYNWDKLVLRVGSRESLKRQEWHIQ